MSLMSIVNPIGEAVSTYQNKKAMDRAYASQEAANRRQEQLQNESLAQEKGFYDLALPAYGSYVAGMTGGVDPNTGRSYTPATSGVSAIRELCHLALAFYDNTDSH